MHNGPGDRGVDVTEVTADGCSIVVQCKSFAPYRPVWSGELQKFLGASSIQHRADVALFVATASFAPEARAIAETYGITLVDRAHLEKWSAGVPLPVLKQQSPGREKGPKSQRLVATSGPAQRIG